MIIAASDVHIGFEKSNKESFFQFLEYCSTVRIDHFVLLGDILDFWRCNNARAIIESQDILALLGSIDAGNMYYIPGNHDYYIHKLAQRYPDSYPFQVRKNVTLADGDSVIHFLHGYEMEVIANFEPLSIENYEAVSERMCFSGTVLGGYATQLWGYLENRNEIAGRLNILKKPPYERGGMDRVRDLALSKGAYLAVGGKPGDKLVYGHTHRPFISEDRRIANTGSWVAEEPVDRPQNTYVKIVDGQIELRCFGVDEFP